MTHGPELSGSAIIGLHRILRGPDGIAVGAGLTPRFELTFQGLAYM
jgi:hypothetical protein